MSLKNNLIFMFFAVLCLSSFRVAAQVDENPDVATGNLLTVSNITIDKTDKNAVAAKEQATTEAKRQALTELAKRLLSPEDAAKYQLPDNQTISTLVMDFEVKNEKLSANRYIADFTVRFNDNILEFLKGSKDSIANFPQSQNYNQSYSPPKEYYEDFSAPMKSKRILVLPYYKNIYGRKILWEDPNPWRNSWQALNGKKLTPYITIIIPIGDIEDISLGNSSQIWDGETSVIENFKKKYDANEIMAVLAEEDVDHLKVEIYNYRKDNFNLDKTINSDFNGSDFSPVISGLLTNDEIFIKSAQNKSSASVKNKFLSIKTSMQLSNFKDWMEAQKRISSIIPKINFNIASLNSSEVILQINLPSIETITDLQTKLYAHGLELKPSENDDGTYILNLKNEE